MHAPHLWACVFGAEFVTTHEYQDLSLANSSLKEQLISALEELGARELEAGELHDAGLKTQARMQSFADQVGVDCPTACRQRNAKPTCVTLHVDGLPVTYGVSIRM